MQETDQVLDVHGSVTEENSEITEGSAPLEESSALPDVQIAAVEPQLESPSLFQDEPESVAAEALVEETPVSEPSSALKAVIEAAIYITDQPLSAEQIAAALGQPLDRVLEILRQLVSEYGSADRGLSVRELAGGYKMSTKPEHHESIRRFVTRLQPPLKLSLAALETLAVVAYKQPITGPEILEIRGVQGAGVLKTLLDRRLIAAAGRKNVLGKPMMYKTTREFLIQFGLNSVAELPTLKEFEELGRFALSDEEPIALEPNVDNPPAATEAQPSPEQLAGEPEELHNGESPNATHPGESADQENENG